MVEAKFIPVTSSTKKSSGGCDPEMHQINKGNQWHLGMKAHIQVRAYSGLVDRVFDTATNFYDFIQTSAPMRGNVSMAFGEVGYKGVDRLPEVIEVSWQVGMRSSKCRALYKNSTWDNLLDQAEQL